MPEVKQTEYRGSIHQRQKTLAASLHRYSDFIASRKRNRWGCRANGEVAWRDCVGSDGES